LWGALALLLQAVAASVAAAAQVKLVPF